MKRIARFHKVSREQFILDWMDCMEGEMDEEDKARAEQSYEQIRLPHRATSGSAGYDFFLPCSLTLAPGKEVKIPTGIRVEMEEGWVLMLYPRSGLGFKYRLQMNNTVGIIDSDYFNSDNEGHILIKMTDDTNEGRTVEVPQGTGFAQGIFIEYGITVDDESVGVRNVVLSSTTK